MRADNTERNSHRMQLAAGAVLIVLAVILGISGFLQQRDVDRETGNAHGYATGYCIGYADRLYGMQQDAQKLAGEIVPYEVGTGKWNYFIMGFDVGYSDGFSGEKIWSINAS